MTRTIALFKETDGSITVYFGFGEEDDPRKIVLFDPAKIHTWVYEWMNEGKLPEAADATLPTRS